MVSTWRRETLTRLLDKNIHTMQVFAFTDTDLNEDFRRGYRSKELQKLQHLLFFCDLLDFQRSSADVNAWINTRLQK